MLAADEAVHIYVSNPITENNIDAERIFVKFYQTSRSRNISGAGIRLYICRQFVEAMNGSITANIDDRRLTINVILNKYYGEV